MLALKCLEKERGLAFLIILLSNFFPAETIWFWCPGYIHFCLLCIVSDRVQNSREEQELRMTRLD